MTRKNILYAIAVTLLVGCSYHRDVSNDACYAGYAKKPLRTAKSLRLYGAGYDLVAAGRRFDLTSFDQGNPYLVGIVPAGAEISNQRILEFHDIGISWKEFVGDVNYMGKAYPFRHHLGTHASPESWKRMFELFQPN